MKIVVSGTWDWRISSLGAQALSDGILAKVREAFPEARIETLPEATLFTGYHAVVRAVQGRSLVARRAFTSLYPLFKRRLPRRVRSLESADLLVVSGDGIVADIFTPATLVLAYDLKTAREAGVTRVSLNQSVNVRAGTLAHHCVEQEFLPAPLSVREPDTIRVLGELFPGREFHLSLDAAFLVDPLSPEERAVYGAMLDRVLSNHGVTGKFVVVGVRANRPREHPIDVKSWAEVLAELSRAYPDHAVLLASTCPEHDIPLALRIAGEFPEAVVLTELIDHGRYSYRFFMHLLSRASLTLSDRYHQNVLAALEETPFLAVEGNTTKTRGTVELTKYPIPVLPLPVPEELGRYRSAIARIRAEEEAIQNHLREHVPPAIAENDRYVPFLREAVAGD